MHRNLPSVLLVALTLVVPLGSVLVTGCSKGEETASTLPESGGGEAMGGPGGPSGSGGGRMAPVAADAKAADIFQQKCQGCHGPNGQGGKAPNLTKVANDPDAELINTIHNGKGRMPAFGNQMTEAQLKELVAYVKQFGAKA